jgi:hypothetical protein
MNTNVVTAKQTDAPFGIDRVPACRDFGIPRQFKHHALTSRPAAGKAASQDFLARSERGQLSAMRLISFSFSGFTESVRRCLTRPGRANPRTTLSCPDSLPFRDASIRQTVNK